MWTLVRDFSVSHEVVTNWKCVTDGKWNCSRRIKSYAVPLFPLFITWTPNIFCLQKTSQLNVVLVASVSLSLVLYSVFNLRPVAVIFLAELGTKPFAEITFSVAVYNLSNCSVFLLLIVDTSSEVSAWNHCHLWFIAVWCWFCAVSMWLFYVPRYKCYTMQTSNSPHFTLPWPTYVNCVLLLLLLLWYRLH